MSIENLKFIKLIFYCENFNNVLVRLVTIEASKGNFQRLPYYCILPYNNRLHIPPDITLFRLSLWCVRKCTHQNPLKFQLSP
nr:MAG TPA: hypothetical protein [Caudoviricetes sp.]